MVEVQNAVKHAQRGQYEKHRKDLPQNGAYPFCWPTVPPKGASLGGRKNERLANEVDVA
jgi:hypothetical protein